MQVSARAGRQTFAERVILKSQTILVLNLPYIFRTFSPRDARQRSHARRHLSVHLQRQEYLPLREYFNGTQVNSYRLPTSDGHFHVFAIYGRGGRVCRCDQQSSTLEPGMSPWDAVSPLPGVPWSSSRESVRLHPSSNFN